MLTPYPSALQPVYTAPSTLCLVRYEELGWDRMLRVGAEFDRMIFQREKETGMIRIEMS